MDLTAALAALETAARDADPAEVPDLVGKLERIKVIALARLATVPRPVKEPPLTARQAAERLNVGVDWIRDHGAEKGLEIRLSAGTVRYDPEAVERLRTSRGSLTDVLR